MSTFRLPLQSIRDIYKAIPSELNSKNKRFISSHVVDRQYLKNYNLEDEFIFLINNGVVIPVFNVKEPISPLLLSTERKTLKLFYNDIGLLINSLVKTDIRKKLLLGETFINYGAPYENVVCEELYAHGFIDNIFYYNSKKLGEIDFIIEYNGEVLPIEIKSGKLNESNLYNHKALNNLIKTYNYKESYIFGETNFFKEDNNIYNFPIYMIAFLKN